MAITTDYTFRFTGDTWEIILSLSFFFNRNITICKKAIKYAFDKPEENREEIKRLHAYIESCAPTHFQYTCKDEQINIKYTKLLDYIKTLEEKHYGKS